MTGTGYPFSDTPNPYECHNLEPRSIRSRPQDTPDKPFEIVVTDNIYQKSEVKGNFSYFMILEHKATGEQRRSRETFWIKEMNTLQ